jgi:hypothetical protein
MIYDDIHDGDDDVFTLRGDDDDALHDVAA